MNTTFTTDPVDDPWAHRSEGMRCKSCMWFCPKAAPGHAQSFDMGRCRRHAPTMSGYPVVFVNDWCGNHKLSEQWVADDLMRREKQELDKQEKEAICQSRLQSLAMP